MKRILLGTIALLALGTAPALPQQKTIKIGFISSFSGPAAAIGNDMRNSFELALDHHGRKLGGFPVEVIYEDDQIKPEVGVQKTQKLIESDKVDFVVGYIWSNVLLASLKPIVDSKTFLVITNAGASQVAEAGSASATGSLRPILVVPGREGWAPETIHLVEGRRPDRPGHDVRSPSSARSSAPHAAGLTRDGDRPPAGGLRIHPEAKAQLGVRIAMRLIPIPTAIVFVHPAGITGSRGIGSVPDWSRWKTGRS